jgi:hypothetical protein
MLLSYPRCGIFFSVVVAAHALWIVAAGSVHCAFRLAGEESCGLGSQDLANSG